MGEDRQSTHQHESVRKNVVHETAKWEKLRWRVRLFILLDFKVRYLTTSVGQSVRYESVVRGIRACKPSLNTESKTEVGKVL